MKICFVHEEYPEETNFGGIATYQKNMAEELVNKGHKVYVICRGLKENKKYIENGVKITRIFVKQTNNQIYNYEKYRKRVSDELKKLQDAEKIDLIEVPDWGAETIFFEKYRKVPIVVRLHTPLKVWLKYNKNNFGKVTRKMLKWEKHMINHADLVTCCSEALKKIIVKDFNIDSKSIIVTPNPANIKKFYYDKSIRKKEELLYVGSLEERKGVIVLAESLNEFFDIYPNTKIKFIGKDTTRNNKNISTIEYIKSLVDDKYQDNLVFLGQIPNYDLNKYLNEAKVGIFPSLFDNFPYVVLEAMNTGLQIVGSSNSGMVEMLDDNSSIYNTGDYHDLTKKIIEKYKICDNNYINEKNIERVNKVYCSKKVVEDIVKIYRQTITEYNIIIELKKVLFMVTDEEIISFKKMKGGVANLVYKVITKNNKYIIKKYNYDYDFKLSKELYDIYEKNSIKVCRPLNEEVITLNNVSYNIFNYIEPNKIKKYKIDFSKLITIKRETKYKSTLKEKCDIYYRYLNKNVKLCEELKDDALYVLEIYNDIKDIELLNDKCLNHGDLSKYNIIYGKNDYYIIDFDETCVSTYLYDFAVVVIKNYVSRDKINIKKYNNLKNKIMKKNLKYCDDDFKNIVKYYLCKILLEKIYLHYVKKIDLFSKEQKRDTYKKYLMILKNLG